MVSFVLKMMISAGEKVANCLSEQTKNPEKVQEELLFSILSKAENTELGREYKLGSVKSVKEFRERFPLTDYDFYSPKIERMIQGEQNILCADPCVHFNVTSGTLGVPKSIPVCESQVSVFSRINAKYLNYIAARDLGHGWTKGKGFSLSEGTYEVLPTGITRGCASSLHTARMQKMMPFLKLNTMDLMYTSPKEARQPAAPGPYSRYLHARFALTEKNITYGNVTFSSYLLEILRYIETNWEMLCDDIEAGSINRDIVMPESDRAGAEKRISPMPERARELREIFRKGFDEPRFCEVWPELSYFACVGGAGFQTYTDAIRKRYFGEKLHILYFGLSASEGMFSVPLSMDSPDAVFVPDSTFMEFIPVANGERDLSRGIKLLSELEKGKCYELVVSNTSGLLRYQMKDVIEVTGFYNNTPTMRFVNRSGYAVNMYAEKTSEQALQSTAENACRELGYRLYDYCVCPKEDEKGGRYVLLYELSEKPERVNLPALAKASEEALCKANPVYGEVRNGGRCEPMEVHLLQDETFLLYRDLMIMKGASAAQLKPVHALKTPRQEKFFLGLINREIEKETAAQQ